MNTRKFFETTARMLITLSFGIVFATASASAQPRLCTKRADLVKTLNAKYQEQRHGLGIVTANTAALEFYASQTGTWTIILTMTNGVTCILAAGHSWHKTSPKVASSGPHT